MHTPSTSSSLVDRVLGAFDRIAPPSVAHAHCDIPCGIYDPHAAQIAALTVLRMNQLLGDLQAPTPNDKASVDAYALKVGRYSVEKERHSEIVKNEVRIIWGDYFRPELIDKY